MNLHYFTVSSKDWGEFKILRPSPHGDNIWGDLLPVKDTPWGQFIPIVTGGSLHQAIKGFATPLMQEIGPHPHGLCRMVPEGYRQCTLINECPMATSKCVPGPKLPRCYRPPGVPLEAAQAVSVVALAWTEERYVVVVQGEEFNF